MIRKNHSFIFLLYQIILILGLFTKVITISLGYVYASWPILNISNAHLAKRQLCFKVVWLGNIYNILYALLKESLTRPHHTSTELFYIPQRYQVTTAISYCRYRKIVKKRNSLPQIVQIFILR